MDITKIEKAVITNVKEVHDYFQLTSTNFLLNIYNSFHVKCNNIILNNHEMLLGKVIKTVKIIDTEALLLELEDNIIICISLADDDYSGPEAVQIKFNTGETIVI
ncbi:hypothetical protein [Cohnella sp.]|uniref:hypothetical protein n=1 Tax=Cohnella sp. TaxID=1883426 RepID=UPI003563AC0E